jgi:hypothetical protein
MVVGKNGENFFEYGINGSGYGFFGSTVTDTATL